MQMSTRESLQAQLNAFYACSLAEFRHWFTSEQLKELSAPFLIAVSDAYLEQPLKVMFVGKETNRWWGKLPKYYEKVGALEELLARYREQLGLGKWQSCPFMWTLARVAKELTGGTTETVLYANLMKMDWGKGGVGYSRNSKEHSKALRELSRKMFRFEVDLLKPDVIIFASGAGYDKVIKDYFPAEERSNSHVIEKDALWQFNIGNTLCFRARHPGALAVKNKFSETSTYYSRIISIVKEASVARHENRLIPPVSASLQPLHSPRG
jgi:hypothetical protein